ALEGETRRVRHLGDVEGLHRLDLRTGDEPVVELLRGRPDRVEALTARPDVVDALELADRPHRGACLRGGHAPVSFCSPGCAGAPPSRDSYSCRVLDPFVAATWSGTSLRSTASRRRCGSSSIRPAAGPM